jgi:hypothetical protein
MLVVLRIASVQSDIGVFPNDPRPTCMAGLSKRTRLRRCCAPLRGSRHVRMRHRPVRGEARI